MLKIDYSDRNKNNYTKIIVDSKMIESSPTCNLNDSLKPIDCLTETRITW